MIKFRKVLISILSILMIFSLVGCGAKNDAETEEPNKNVEDQVEQEEQEEQEEEKMPGNTEDFPIATIKIKDFGTIEVELYPNKAPNTVKNFISLSNSKFYDGLIFHRVIKGFMNQGGDPDGNGTGGPGYAIEGEFKNNGYDQNDIKHTKGVLSMARSQNPNSAGSQFFIMAEDAPHLDGDYAAFGEVISGLDIVEKINSVKTDGRDKPVEPVVIEEIRVDTKGIDYRKPEKIK